jgi:DNA-binding NtrC family response regulator
MSNRRARRDHRCPCSSRRFTLTKVLFVDDDPDVWIGRFRRILPRHGIEVAVEADPRRALTRLADEGADVILLDSLFRRADGAVETRGPELLRQMSDQRPDVPVVIFTASLGTIGVDEADFPEAAAIFCKDRFADPDCDPDLELAETLIAAVQSRQEQRSLDEQLGFVVGMTSAMRATAQKLLRIAPQPWPVLIYGETGTGKELAAKALHAHSGRANGPLIAIDCGRYSGPTLESELFGHERHAFTGAAALHRGFFEQASGGTLFLDEIHAMTSELQDKLLRAVEEMKIRRMGGSKPISVDVRIVAATNRRLAGLVEEGSFRNDLYQRLSRFVIELPPLRERLDDLPALYRQLTVRLNGLLGKRVSTTARADVLAKLGGYDWPANIRELESVLGRAIASARANVLTPSTIEFEEAPEATGGSPVREAGADLLDRAARGELTWEELKLVRGEFRRRTLLALLVGFRRREGRDPGSADLALSLGTKDNNVRQVLGEFGGLRELRLQLEEVRRVG